MNLNYQNSVEKLLEAIPEFLDSEEFKYFEDDTNLLMVIFATFRNFYIKIYQNRKTDLIQKMSDFLEEVSAVDTKAMKELICFGFLENIDPLKIIMKVLFPPLVQRLAKG